LFLPKQTLWLDESTQMSGLSLGPVSISRWLAGSEPHDLGQFPDRMPPLSYWVGRCWSQIFGLRERPMRWLGLLEVAVAAGIIYEAARIAFGKASTWLAGLSFALLPMVVVLAVEIRAYPLFLLESSAAFLFLVRLLKPADRPGSGAPDAVAMALALSAAIATHFFGLVLSVSILSAWWVGTWMRRGSWIPALAVTLVVGLAVLAITPFVVQAMRISGGNATGDPFLARLNGVANYLDGLAFHQTLGFWPPLPAGFKTGSRLLCGLAIIGALSGRASRLVFVLMIAALVGLGMTTAAKLTFGSFDATTPSYSVWIIPCLCLVMSAALSVRSRTARSLAVTAGAVLLVSEAAAATVLLQHGHHFAHGPHAPVARLIRDLGPREVAVIHDDPTYHLVFVYCPLRYEFGTNLSQFQTMDVASAGPIPVQSFEKHDHSSKKLPVLHWVEDLPQRYLVVVNCRFTQTGDLLHGIRSGRLPFEEGPAAAQLRSSPEWRPVGSRSILALDSAIVTVFERRPRRIVNCPSHPDGRPFESRR
jgi:hypothetical protein